MAGALILLIIGLPWLGAAVVWLAGDKHESRQHLLAVGFSVVTGLLALLLLGYATDDTVISIAAGGVFGDFTFVPNGLGVFLTAVATIIGSLAVIFSVDYMRGEAQLGRYYALVLFFIGAMAGLVLSGSLLMMFFFWEITALCSYALISFNNDDPKAVAGGIKALVITSLGGVGLFVGAVVIYAYQGSYQIADFLSGAEALPPEVLSFLAFGFLAAAAAKSAQFPFQTWLPGAMEAPTPISALIHAATMVNAGVYLLARFYPAFEAVPGWTTAVVLVGLISALLAAFMALTAGDLKRVLAYSTISQLGYMFYAIGVGGIFASQFHLLSHAVFKALLFLGAGAVIHAVGTRDMFKMGALSRVMPFTRNVFVVGALALAGLPILNGFWSKELILEAGLAEGPVWAYLGMLLGAGITALYTFRFVYLVFFASSDSEPHAHDAGSAMRVALGVLAAGTFLTWLLAEPFGTLLNSTLPHHHLHTFDTGGLIGEIIAAPATWLAMGVIAIGLGLWLLRGPLAALARLLEPLANIAANDFGFEWLNRRIVTLTQDAASALQTTQTGHLNWNVAGITGGLVVVLVILLLAWGA